MLELIEGLPGNVVGIAVSGRLTMQDCQDVLVPAMQRSLKRHDKIRLYYELNSRFPGAAWDDLELGLEDLSRCERVAIITDVGWVRLTVKALRFLIPSEIRVFPTVQADEGRAWIKARPRPQTEVEAGTAAPVRARRMRSRREGDRHPRRQSRELRTSRIKRWRSTRPVPLTAPVSPMASSCRGSPAAPLSARSDPRSGLVSPPARAPALRYADAGRRVRAACGGRPSTPHHADQNSDHQAQKHSR